MVSHLTLVELSACSIGTVQTVPGGDVRRYGVLNPPVSNLDCTWDRRYPFTNDARVWLRDETGLLA